MPGSMVCSLGLAIAVFVPAGALAGPSFDCDRASTPTERQICAHASLSNLDARLDSYYDEARRTLGNGAGVRDAQRAWLRRRNDCGADVGCIEARYEQRIDELVQRLPQANAGARYRLVEEEYSDFLDTEQHGMCTAVVGRLNRMDPVRPMVCGFDLPDGSGAVSTPDWKELDPKEHMELIREIVRYRDEPYDEEDRAENWVRNKAVIESGHARLWRAAFDINNESGRESVIRSRLWNCGMQNSVTRSGFQQFGIAVLNGGESELDQESYWRLHRHPYYQPFFYRGRTWLWRWWGSFSGEDAEAAVYQTAYARAQFGWYNHATCEIDYVDGTENK